MPLTVKANTFFWIKAVSYIATPKSLPCLKNSDTQWDRLAQIPQIKTVLLNVVILPLQMLFELFSLAPLWMSSSGHMHFIIGSTLIMHCRLVINQNRHCSWPVSHSLTSLVSARLVVVYGCTPHLVVASANLSLLLERESFLVSFPIPLPTSCGLTPRQIASRSPSMHGLMKA